jgi:hypothetical protein
LVVHLHVIASFLSLSEIGDRVMKSKVNSSNWVTVLTPYKFLIQLQLLGSICIFLVLNLAILYRLGAKSLGAAP